MSLVKITNMVNNSVSVAIPELNFKRTWPRKGSVISIDLEKLKEMQYDPGFEYMLREGILYIEDMNAKKELGLEPEDASAPENIIVLTEKQQKEYMTELEQKDFEEKVSKLSLEQVQSLADYAVNNKLSDMDKCNFLKKLCGRDVIQSIINGSAAE